MQNANWKNGRQTKDKQSTNRHNMSTRLLEVVLAEAGGLGEIGERLSPSVLASEPICCHVPLALHGECAAEVQVVASKLAEDCRSAIAKVNAQSKTSRFHTRCSVDSVAEQTVAGHLKTDDTRHDGARVEAHTELQLGAGHVPDGEGRGGVEEIQGHRSNFARMAVAVARRETRRHHVCITNGLDLVHIILIDAVIECSIKVVEEVDNLEGRALSGNDSETNNVTEEDCDRVKALGVDLLAGLEVLRNRPRQHAVQQLVRLELLVIELLGALLNKTLKVVRIRFEHLGHGVNNVHAGVGVDVANALGNKGKCGAGSRVCRNALINKRNNLLGHLVVLRQCRAEALVTHLAHNLLRFKLKRLKGELAGDELRQNNAKAVHVALLRAAGVGRGPRLQNFGGDPQLPACAIEVGLVFIVAQFVRYPSEPKIGDLAHPSRINNKVRRRQAAV
eukprot:Opistho-2@78858